MTEAYNLIDALHHLTVVNNSQTVYWNVYVTAILAILGFIASEYMQRQSKQMHLFLIIGFIVFTSANLVEIYLSQHHINVITESVTSYVKSHENLIDKAYLPIFGELPHIDANLVLGFHLVIDFFVTYVMVIAYKKALTRKK